MNNIAATHHELVKSLIAAWPDSERANELRIMIARLERVQPDLERQRLDVMRDTLERPRLFIEVKPHE